MESELDAARRLISFRNINFIAGDFRHHYGKICFYLCVECLLLYLKISHRDDVKYDIIISANWPSNRPTNRSMDSIVEVKQ